MVVLLMLNSWALWLVAIALIGLLWRLTIAILWGFLRLAIALAGLMLLNMAGAGALHVYAYVYSWCGLLPVPVGAIRWARALWGHLADGLRDVIWPVLSTVIERLTMLWSVLIYGRAALVQPAPAIAVAQMAAAPLGPGASHGPPNLQEVPSATPHIK